MALNVPRCRADGRAVMMIWVLMSPDVGLMDRAVMMMWVLMSLDVGLMAGP